MLRLIFTAVILAFQSNSSGVLILKYAISQLKKRLAGIDTCALNTVKPFIIASKTYLYSRHKEWKDMVSGNGITSEDFILHVSYFFRFGNWNVCISKISQSTHSIELHSVFFNYLFCKINLYWVSLSNICETELPIL